MKKLLFVFVSVCALGLLLNAADKPAQPPPPKWEIVNAPPDRYRPAGSDVGRFQIVVTGEPHPMVMKIDTATGRAWKYLEAMVENKNGFGKLKATGWSEIPEDFSADLGKQVRFNP